MQGSELLLLALPEHVTAQLQGCGIQTLADLAQHLADPQQQAWFAQATQSRVDVIAEVVDRGLLLVPQDKLERALRVWHEPRTYGVEVTRESAATASATPTPAEVLP